MRKWQVATVVLGASIFITATVVVRGELTASTTLHNEQFKMAKYLLHGTGFVCPVGPERDDPSSWYSPGYIGLMSAIMAGLGEESAVSLAVIRLSNIAAVSVAIGLYFIDYYPQIWGSSIVWLGDDGDGGLDTFLATPEPATLGLLLIGGLALLRRRWSVRVSL